MNERGINYRLISDKSRPTTFKKRYMVDNQKLLRVSKIEESDINQDIEEMVIREIKKEIKELIVSSFQTSHTVY